MSTLSVDQLIAVSVIPIITSTCASIISKILDCAILFITNILKYFLLKIDKYSPFKTNKVEIIFNTISIDSRFKTMHNYTPTGKAIIWYINSIIKNMHNTTLIEIDNDTYYIPAYRDTDFAFLNKDSAKQVDVVTGIDDILIEKNIYLGIKKYINYSQQSRDITEILEIKSRKYGPQYLSEFIKNAQDKYTEYIKTDTIKIFTFTKSDSFTMAEADTSQNFENLFFSHKEKILKDLRNLQNNQKYKKFGIKKKLSYLFSGLPGTGKTSIVTCLAAHLKRHIVNIPISRVKKNSELEQILYTRKYNGITFKRDEVIFLFDEIDSFSDEGLLLKNKQTEPKIDTEQKTIIVNNNDSNAKHIDLTEKNSDDLNVGIFLTLLDGNLNQDDMIIIATANDVSKIDPAFKRNGRLEELSFEHVGRSEIVEMLEYYFDCKLTQKQKDSICDDRTINSLKIKQMCIDNIDICNIDDVILQINNLYLLK